MSRFAAPAWVIASVCALTSYLVVLAAYLVRVVTQGSYEFQALNLYVSMIVAVVFGLPTVLLAVLLFVPRIARVAGVVAVAWMTFNAFFWSAIPDPVGPWAAFVPLVILGSMLVDWWRRGALQT